MPLGAHKYVPSMSVYMIQKKKKKLMTFTFLIETFKDCLQRKRHESIGFALMEPTKFGEDDLEINDKISHFGLHLSGLIVSFINNKHTSSSDGSDFLIFFGLLHGSVSRGLFQ
ncbi:hypothetical protein NPIL_346241 [Nephila pilipes]|uniref:Uncharacterized protein n=1 Tax=Nephila pilipes TaxID=299642 RepID=A0A8X6QQY2_NEPPI|nr:hypothetical protein NPIL_346241 [Nephila pilipes]